MMAAWQHGSMAAWQHGSMAAWQHGSMAAWQHGSMAAWQHGSMAAWQHGSMAAWLQGSMVAYNEMAAVADARGFDCSVLAGDSSQNYGRHRYLSVTKTGHKVKFKWLGDFEELKLFVNAVLNISGTWSYTTNNGGFHNLKAEGISISFYPGTKTLNV